MAWSAAAMPRRDLRSRGRSATAGGGYFFVAVFFAAFFVFRRRFHRWRRFEIIRMCFDLERAMESSPG
jgi:hypothetical protein